MDLLTQSETLSKWSKLIALTNAYRRAIEAGEWVDGRYKYTVEQAIEIAYLDAQRKELRATMAPRLV